MPTIGAGRLVYIMQLEIDISVDRVERVYTMSGENLRATIKGKVLVVVHVHASSVTWSFGLNGILLLPSFWSYSFAGCV